MNLTAGATLQNHKYVIQKLLRQSDLGITYEAQHAYLAQTVALQTFNETVRQRSDFEQLRQQFLSKVRSIVQQPKASPIRVLDCFEEAELPFVVLEIVPHQPLPLLTDWLPILVDEPINPTQLIPSEAETPAPSQTPHLGEKPLTDSLLGHSQADSNGAVGAAIGGSAEETLPPTPGYPAQLHTPELNFHRHPTATQQQSFTVPVTAPAATVMGTQVVQRPISIRPRSKAWMPLSLIFLSITGAIVGAGLGLSLRLSSTAPPNTAATQDATTPKPRLFSREQSFPSDAEWPISETPESYIADPMPIEEPVYRVPAIESYTPPELPPFPNESGYQDPAAMPSPSPTVGTAPPTQPDYQPVPLPDALVEDAPAPISPPPQISAPPAPLTPEALEPSLPQLLSEPSEPAPPPEPAPPLLPPTDPAIIKQ